jgi:hypothetical protein
VTFGDPARGTAETADGPRWPSEDEVITDDARGHVREDNTSTSDESGMPDCGSADGTAEPPADTDSDRSSGLVARWLGRFHPPDIWGDRPGLSKLAAYAHHGSVAPAAGPMRAAEIWWYRLVGFPITAWAYWKAWLLERPLRGTPVLILQLAWWSLNIATLARLLS